MDLTHLSNRAVCNLRLRHSPSCLHETVLAFPLLAATGCTLRYGFEYPNSMVRGEDFAYRGPNLLQFLHVLLQEFPSKGLAFCLHSEA